MLGPLHDLVRLGRPDDVADRLDTLAGELDGAWGPAFALHARAAAAGDAGLLAEAVATFEQMGACGHAVDAARAAADASARAGDQRAASGWSARAAELPAPMMAVYPHLDDDAGLAASCRAGRALGFLGRTAVHPRQLRTIVDAFRPAAAEVMRAQSVVNALARAERGRAGLTVLPSGEMLDVAMLAPLDGGPRQVLGRHRVVRTALLRPFGLVGPRRGVRSTLEAPAGSFARWGLTTAAEVELRTGGPRQP